MGVLAQQTPVNQILPLAPTSPDIQALLKWAQDLSRTLQQNLAGIARKANDTSTVPLTQDLNANGFNITNAKSVRVSAVGDAFLQVVSTTTGHGALFKEGTGGNTAVVFDSLSGIGLVLQTDTTANIGAGTTSGATTRWTLSPTGNVIMTGPLDMSNAASGQIVFPATQNPSAGVNTLDDYEEGTWTPTVTAQSGTFTTVSATGSYTKIGRLVTVSIVVTITTVGTAAGYVFVSVPFTAGSGFWTLAGRENNVTGKMLQATINSGASSAFIFNYDNSSAIGAGTSLVVSGSYWAS